MFVYITCPVRSEGPIPACLLLCLVMNVVPVTAVSFDPHTAKPAMTPQFVPLREARCFHSRRVPQFCPRHGKVIKSTL